VRIIGARVNFFFSLFEKNRFNNPEESAEIYENEPSGTVVKRLQARSTSSLLFELVEGDVYNLFTVNPSTGVLITKRPLDYELCHVYNLSVTATNMVSRPTLSCISRDESWRPVRKYLPFSEYEIRVGLSKDLYAQKRHGNRIIISRK